MKSKVVILIFGIVIFQSVSFAQKNVTYLDPPRLIRKPESSPEHSAISRKFTGIPSLAISENGQMWATWYAGVTPEEDSNNYVVVATSIDAGQTWEEILVIDPDGPGPVRSYDPEIWIDPEGKLWVFWAQASPGGGTWSLITEGTSAGVWAITSKPPYGGKPKWSKPRRLTDGVMMCKPMVSSKGEWILPVSAWKLQEGNAQMHVSTDLGKTWNLRGAASVPDDVRSYDEHIIVERKDKSFWMLIRTNFGIGESISVDRGFNWSSLNPSKIQNPSARFFIRRLQSGNLLMVKHGPVNLQTDRSQLMAFISVDEGHNWSGGLILDERSGVSYPDGQQSENGRIYIIYDYNRRSDQNILIASFREEDVISADPDAETVSLRILVSKGGNDY